MTQEKKKFRYYKLFTHCFKIVYVKRMEKHNSCICFVFSSDLDFEAAEFTSETLKVFLVLIFAYSTSAKHFENNFSTLSLSYTDLVPDFRPSAI